MNECEEGVTGGHVCSSVEIRPCWLGFYERGQLDQREYFDR